MTSSFLQNVIFNLKLYPFLFLVLFILLLLTQCKMDLCETRSVLQQLRDSKSLELVKVLYYFCFGSFIFLITFKIEKF